MSTFHNIYQKMVPALDPSALAPLHRETSPQPNPTMIEGELAHELNNILTIIQGYADRMVMKHGENPVLSSDLKVISNNARRAVAVVRNARKMASMSVGA